MNGIPRMRPAASVLSEEPGSGAANAAGEAFSPVPGAWAGTRSEYLLAMRAARFSWNEEGYWTWR